MEGPTSIVGGPIPAQRAPLQPVTSDHLVALLHALKTSGYAFRAVTPETHARVLARPAGRPSLRDVFGWSRPFGEKDLPDGLLRLLRDADLVEESAGGLRSRVRVASLGNDLFLHSPFPTVDREAVFFGPDTYRFAAFIARELAALRPRLIVDLGAGSGAGGIYAKRCCPEAEIALVDINPAALDLAHANAQAASLQLQFATSMDEVGVPDLVIANPPYLMDGENRVYRDGGELLGGQVALAWVQVALDVLQPGGAVLLYTGVPYIDGQSPLIDALERLCRDQRAALTVEEIDPDVFGEELAAPQYSSVERIAVVGVTIRKAGMLQHSAD